MADTPYDPNAELRSLTLSVTPAAEAPAPPVASASPVTTAPTQDAGSTPSDYNPNAELGSFLGIDPPAAQNLPYDPKGVVDPYANAGDFMMLPEIRSHYADPLALLGLIASDKNSFKAIVKQHYPKVGIHEDKDGNVVYSSDKDKKDYVFKTGRIQLGDAIRGALGGAVTAGSGVGALTAGAPTLLASLIGGGLGVSELAYLRHKAGGAPLSSGELLGALGLQMGIHGIGKLGQTIGTRMFGNLPEAPLGETMVDAARGDTGAADRFASQVNPNADVVAAAKALPGQGGEQGIISRLTPAQISDNPELQTLSRALPNAAATDAEGYRATGQALDQLLSQNEGPIGPDYAEKVRQKIGEFVESSRKGYNAAYEAVGVPKGAPAPAPATLAAIEQMAKDNNGNIPELVENIKRILTPEDGSQPTWDTVDTLRKELGAATKGKGAYKNLNASGRASALRAALDADQLAAADLNSAEAGARFRAAQDAFKAHNELRASYVSVLGKRGENSLAAKLGSATKMLGFGVPEGFEHIMAITPPELRSDVARSALFQFIDKNGAVDAPTFTKWFEALRRNQSSFDALKNNLGEEMTKNLENVYTVTKAIKSASEKGVPHFETAFPDRTPLPVLVKNLFQNYLKARAIKAVPFESEVKYVVADRVFGTKSALADALQNFITSPAGRKGMEESIKGPVSTSFADKIGATLDGRKLMNAFRVPMSERQLLWQSLFATGAAGTPLVTGAPWNSQEDK